MSGDIAQPKLEYIRKELYDELKAELEKRKEADSLRTASDWIKHFIQQNDEITALKSQLALAVECLDESYQRFGDDHPVWHRVANALEKLK